MAGKDYVVTFGEENLRFRGQYPEGLRLLALFLNEVLETETAIRCSQFTVLPATVGVPILAHRIGDHDFEEELPLSFGQVEHARRRVDEQTVFKDALAWAMLGPTWGGANSIWNE